MKILTILFSFLVFVGYGQQTTLNSILQSKIHHFNSFEYGGKTQNWDICQGKNSLIYVANSSGLMEFNGIDWKIYQLPGQKIVRSVAADTNGILYTGGLGEFGYWKKDKNGQLVYFSLKELIKDKEFPHEEIWKILILNDQILFQSFGFMYSYQHNKVVKIKLPGPILFSFEAHGKVYAEVIGLGLYELVNNSMVLIPNTQLLGKEAVCSIMNGRNSDEIIIAGSNNIFILTNGKISIFNQSLTNEIKGAKINKAIKLSNGQFVFGTLLNGIYLTDVNGNILNHYNQFNGLQNNTVLSLFETVNRELWIGLNSGIDLIHNLDNTHFADRKGDIGSIFDATFYQKTFYISTNHGIYRLKGKSFELIENTQGQGLYFSIINQQLYCGHNNGTYHLKDNRAQLISSITGGSKIKPLLGNKSYFIQGSYTKFSLYQLHDHNLKFLRAIDGFSDPIVDFYCISPKQILAHSTTWGISKLYLDDNQMKFEIRKKIVGNLPNSSVFTYLGNKYIFTGKEFYFYQQMNKRLVRTPNPFNPIQVSKVMQTDTNEVIVFNQLGQAIFFPQNKSAENDQLDLPENEEYRIVKINKNAYLIAGNEGFDLIDTRRKITNFWDRPFVHSLQIFSNDTNYTLFPGIQTNSLSNTLAYNQNQLKFKIGLLNASHQTKLYYKLMPLHNFWNEFTDFKGGIVFNKLPPGEYKLLIKSNKNAHLKTFAFSISDPWYWSPISKSFYFLLLLFSIWVAYQIHLHRLKVKQDEISKEMAYQIQIREERNKQELIRLKNEKLEIDLSTKKEELSNLTFSIMKRNESLQKIKIDLDRIKPLGDQKSYIFQSILQQIEENFNSKKEWKIFEKNFNEVHESFFKKLLAKFPDLSHGDLGLAAYLKMNLSSKEISQILNITLRSVELKRYRLRKKLSLPTEQGLTEFLMNI